MRKSRNPEKMYTKKIDIISSKNKKIRNRGSGVEKVENEEISRNGAIFSLGASSETCKKYMKNRPAVPPTGQKEGERNGKKKKGKRGSGSVAPGKTTLLTPFLSTAGG